VKFSIVLSHIHLSLSVQLGKNYPYVVPTIELRDVSGLSKKEQRELMDHLDKRAKECAQTGSVMMCELVQVVEDYLLEHNLDPSMSAWEQMKAREALQKKEEQEAKRQQEKQLREIMMQEHDKTDEFSHGRMGASGGEVEKELARQMEALAAADRKRRGFPAPEAPKEESNDEGDDESDFDGAEMTPFVGSSRYQTDFIELGLLGRGGGGEVVKVRNRLDRRLYAVKKIVLESEEGKFASVGAIQNRKLKREVTTISRLLHKNIVRYYQAWVEGGNMEAPREEEVELIMEEDNTSQNDESSGQSSSAEGFGFWTNSPTEGIPANLLSHGDGVDDMEDFSEGSSDDASWVAEDEDTVDVSNPRGMPARRDSHSASIEDLLGHEYDYQVR
jgi:translation initiation factor 2-alpha kinase 4